MGLFYTIIFSAIYISSCFLIGYMLYAHLSWKKIKAEITKMNLIKTHKFGSRRTYRFEVSYIVNDIKMKSDIRLLCKPDIYGIKQDIPIIVNPKSPRTVLFNDFFYNILGVWCFMIISSLIIFV